MAFLLKELYKLNLAEINRKYEVIMNSSDAKHVKVIKLASLMTDMEGFFSIPMLRNENWERENPKVIALYRKISISRSF
ncbi:hypothetical protein ACM26V_00225 [Salipaludibacillus sp. HK11]|uniref:hypothetical protein n=1 Tax=Salipaludibacillus sp. HK11 TaxID=3394320 RepID=UPI0039FC1888